jgi:hypothetical protein
MRRHATGLDSRERAMGQAQDQSCRTSLRRLVIVAALLDIGEPQELTEPPCLNRLPVPLWQPASWRRTSSRSRFSFRPPRYLYPRRPSRRTILASIAAGRSRTRRARSQRSPTSTGTSRSSSHAWSRSTPRAANGLGSLLGMTAGRLSSRVWQKCRHCDKRRSSRANRRSVAPPPAPVSRLSRAPVPR